ncbi:hypothetical protein KMZ93_01365 [Bradyrhizobium sediminis]|uniref:Uncharacterized protein n=1 Tax=Bradyrhizobium sediminis TaxID=2840469 RepID=A0A975P134_9BRAD|nr:hypothetical protein [Bradyrhizobium sediminis]QWG23629.1 hypothetical protein KMZ93_01365 [Bradyrhizobium sediminis]
MNLNFDWPGIVRTLLVQVLVLLALTGAVVWYLNWSSGLALEEFIRADKSSVSSSNHQSQVPAQTVKSKSACAPKA